MFDLVLALLLLAAAAALIGMVLRVVLGALGIPFQGAVQRWRLKLCLERAARGDEHLAAGELDRALRQLQAAVFTPAAKTTEIADVARKHHFGILSRLLAACDQTPGGSVRLLSLAKADRILGERRQIQDRYLAALRRGDRAAQRGARRALAENTARFRSTLADLIREVRTVRDARPAVH